MELGPRTTLLLTLADTETQTSIEIEKVTMDVQNPFTTETWPFTIDIRCKLLGRGSWAVCEHRLAPLRLLCNFVCMCYAKGTL